MDGLPDFTALPDISLIIIEEENTGNNRNELSPHYCCKA
jgi:hypothetical protein